MGSLTCKHGPAVNDSLDDLRTQIAEGLAHLAGRRNAVEIEWHHYPALAQEIAIRSMGDTIVQFARPLSFWLNGGSYMSPSGLCQLGDDFENRLGYYPGQIAL